MFAEKGKKQVPKLFSEGQVQRNNHLKPAQKPSPCPFDTGKKLHSKSPSNPKLSSLSPRRKTLKKPSSRLFEAAHLPLSGETYLVPQPSRRTEVRLRPYMRALSNEDMRVAHSMKQRRLDITNQFQIKITGELSSLSLIINQFQEGGQGSGLAEVLENSGETLRIDSNLTSNPGDFVEI